MADRPHAHRCHGHRFSAPPGRWSVVLSIIGGVSALLWLILRSGLKPSRISYPCQRAAAGTVAFAFGVPAAAALLAMRQRLTLWMRARAVATAAVVGLAATVALSVYFTRAAVYSGPVIDPPDAYRAKLFHVADCPPDPGGDHFVGLSNLLGVMGRGGLKFYKSATVSPLAGPDGIVAPEDVVVIKINYQWDQRGGTNVDLLRGLIRSILDHPDGFTGEVIVCENAQFNAVSNFDRASNNAQDHGLSPHDVVVAFQGQGRNVSHFDWTLVRGAQVDEYSAGDTRDGYIVGPYDASWHGKLSYPKFRTVAGTYISLRYGIWNPDGATYDRAHLKFINVPVLKSHHSTYGATVSTKHYMGVVTDQFTTNSHSGIRYGIMGALMGTQIQKADLNIVDAIWINANPNSGPQTSYTGATRRDELVASLDPIALDRWSVKNILIPGFLGNGYNPPWPNPSADPDLPTGAFRTYLDNSMNQLLAAGVEVTNDYAQMDVLSGSGTAGDFDHNGTVDQADFDHFTGCYTGPGGGPVGPECAAGDFDGDGDVDCEDWQMFQLVWTSTQPVPPFDPCGPTGVPEERPRSGRASLSPPVPNPSDSGVRIGYSVPAAGRVRLSVYDVNGRAVRNLLDGEQAAGAHSIAWDGRNEAGAKVGRGVYTYRLEAAGLSETEKIVIR